MICDNHEYVKTIHTESGNKNLCFNKHYIVQADLSNIKMNLFE